MSDVTFTVVPLAVGIAVVIPVPSECSRCKALVVDEAGHRRHHALQDEAIQATMVEARRYKSPPTYG